MSDLMELTELEFNDNDFGNQHKTSNFGGGLELLMNDKVRDKNRPTSDIDMEDLSRLESELNGLVDDTPSSGSAYKSDLFDKQNVSFEQYPSVNLNFDNNEPTRLGMDMANLIIFL